MSVGIGRVVLIASCYLVASGIRNPGSAGILGIKGGRRSGGLFKGAYGNVWNFARDFETQ